MYVYPHIYIYLYPYFPLNSLDSPLTYNPHCQVPSNLHRASARDD